MRLISRAPRVFIATCALLCLAADEPGRYQIHDSFRECYLGPCPSWQITDRVTGDRTYGIVILPQSNDPIDPNAPSAVVQLQGLDWDLLVHAELREHAPPRYTPTLVISKIVGQISTKPGGEDATPPAGAEAADGGASAGGIVREAVRFMISNLPAILFALAIVLAAVSRRPVAPWPERLLAWLLLLPIGVTGLWAGVFHVFFPHIAATLIGWDVSPFQFEVGMADLAIGITACIAFWQPLPFKAAAVCAASVFLLGDAVGHVHQMLAAGNFASGNAGVPFYMDVICPLLAIILLFASRQHEVVPGVRPRRRSF